MAQFDADIKLKVAVENLEASVRKVENAFKKVQDYRVKLKVDGQNELKSLGNSFKRLGQIVKTSGIVTAVAAITGSLQSLNNLPLIGGGLNTSALGNVVSQLGAFSNAAADAAASAPGLAAGIAASTAALVAFAPQIGRAVKDTIKIGKVAAEAQVPINKLLTIIGAATSSGSLGGFGDAAAGVEEYRRRIFELNESVSNLRQRADRLKSSLNQYNSGSATAEKIATKLVAVNARLNDELREQADLLRRVAGVNVTELEAAKGRKSIETGQKRDQFLARQAQEAERVQKSLLDLAEAQAAVDNARLNARAEQEQIRQEQMVRAANDETIKSLERRLAIEEKIANVRSARAARTASADALRQEQLSGYREDLRAEGAGRASAFAKLQQVENKAKLDAARLTQQLTGEQIAQNRVIAEATARFEQTIAANKEAAAAEKERQAALNASTAAARKNAAATKRQAAKERGQRLESLALGVGFPLLFGGGAGSVIGSALGSFAGSGFGGQIVGGAVGQAIDDLFQSVGQLGQAFNALTPDVDRLVEAAGLAGTATGELIKSVEQAEGAQKAQAIAAEQMAVFVGQDGVKALKDAGDAASELGREASKAFTALATALAPALEAVADFLAKNIQEQRQLSRVDPGVFGVGAGDLAGREDVQQVRQDFASRTIDEAEARARLLAIVKEIEAVEQQIFDTRLQSNRTLTESYDQVRQQFELSQAELEVARLGGDLKNENVFKAEQQNIKLQFAIKYQQLLNEAVKTEADRRIINLKLLALENQELAALANLESRRDRALAGGTGGSSGVDKEAQAQKALASELTKQFELETKLATVDTTKLEKINIELGRLEAKRALKQAELELNTEDSRVLAAKLETLNLETKLLREQLELQKKRAEVEKTISGLKDRQRLDALSEDLDRELSNALTLPTGNTFQDEQNALLARQDERRATTLRKLNNQIKVQNTLLEIGTEAQKADAKANIPILQEELALYERMLPAIAAAEQQQLKFNQTLSLVEGPVNAFVNGLTEGLQGIIDGTMTAEEAFSKMLKGMAQALMQTAAQMIAQYIAIGIAKAFAGMGGGGSYGTGGETPISGIPFSAGGIGYRAGGGPVNGDLPYIVGENGPELFIPGKSGTVVNNDDFADAAAALSDNSGSFEESSEALEMATAARGGNTSAALAGAIQAFADSGSAMAMASSNRASNSAAAAQASALQTAESYFSAGTSTVTFDTYRVGEMDVVTREDAMKIGMESARKAEANVYKGLKNMPAIRGRSGVK